MPVSDSEPSAAFTANGVVYEEVTVVGCASVMITFASKEQLGM